MAEERRVEPEPTGEWKCWQKKPLQIEAVQMETAFTVETLEGTMKGKAADFLVRGIRGELYPVDREIFFASYELRQEGRR